MTRRRGYILQFLALCGLALILFVFSRIRSEPVVIAPYGKPKHNDRQVMFIITNSTPEDLKWIPIVDVGGPNRWSASAKQPPPTVKKGSTYRTLPAHTAYWLVVSVPEERGSWRVRCIVMREQTPLEQRFSAILTKLRLARWQWSVTSPSLPPRDG